MLILRFDYYIRFSLSSPLMPLIFAFFRWLSHFSPLIAIDFRCRFSPFSFFIDIAAAAFLRFLMSTPAMLILIALFTP